MASEPWYLTVIRTEGVLYLRPDKTWRPIVTVTLIDIAHPPYEVLLGCDGQNPNTKVPFVLNDVDETTQLEISIWHNAHKSHKKSRRGKRHLVGSAYVALSDLLKRQEQPGAELYIHLRCPPAQKRSPKLQGQSRQSNGAVLTVRLKAPSSLLPASDASSSSTLAATPSLCDSDSGSGSELDHSECESEAQETETPWGPQPSPTDGPGDDDDLLAGKAGLRRRKRKCAKRRTIKPYCINSSDEESSLSDASCTTCPSEDESPRVSIFTFAVEDCEEDEDGYAIGRVLPVLPQTVEDGPQPLSLMERLVDRFAPYCEMSGPECDFGLVQRRLIGEWYTVAASLIGIAGLNAAVFGFSQGTLFDVDTVAMRCVTFGCIAAAIGLAVDIGFLVLYSGSDIDKFERVTRDVYGSYFFFCLTCRFPTLCLFVATVSLMAFLLAVAWTAWPTAVLVMCVAAGAFLTLQYLVYGVHRFANLVVWIVQRVWRGIYTVKLALWKRSVAIPVLAHVESAIPAGETAPPPPGGADSTVPSPTPQSRKT